MKVTMTWQLGRRRGAKEVDVTWSSGDPGGGRLAHSGFGHVELQMYGRDDRLRVFWRRYDWMVDNSGHLGDVLSGGTLDVPEFGPVMFTW